MHVDTAEFGGDAICPAATARLEAPKNFFLY